MILEGTLTHLGFEKFSETPESSGSDNDWYYYTLDIGSLCLITQSSDEVVNGWEVSVFDDDSVKITDPNELMILIGVLTRNKVK
jgi:hypothetical protein